MADQQSIRRVKRQAENKARKAADNPWVERLARLGYAAKGVVYATVGILALQAALGRGGAATGTQGALQTIASQPLGTFLLAIVGVGLLGYALWRFVEATVDPRNHGSDAQGIAQRLGYAIRGALYVGLALSAFRIISGGGGGNGNATEDWTARVLAWPFGTWLVGLAGLVIIGAGLYEMYRAYSEEFRDELKMGEMSHTEREWTMRLGKVGLVARGVVFALTGLFLIQAVIRYDAAQAGGLDQALQTLAQQPYGPWLLGIAALGLIAYSLFMFIEARYLRLDS
jgi:hypothetical protein